MKFVIKIGGSLAFDESGPRIGYLKKFQPIFAELKKKKHQVIVTIGGGKFIRRYLQNVKGQISKEQIEWIFVDLLKANARLLSYLFGLEPIFDLDKVNKNTSGVISGIMPGRSTDANAAICAEKIGADLFVKLTNVEGIFNKDPKKYKNAKLIKNLSFKDIGKIKEKKTSPANYGILDPLALSIISRRKIRTVVMNGDNPKNLTQVLQGKFFGTVIG